MTPSNHISNPNFDNINPQDCLNAKLRKLHRMVNTAYQNKIASFGLKGSMLSILFIVGKKNGINQKTISEMLVLDASTMSRDIKKLMSNGWIIAHKGSDSRNTELMLSKKGFDLLEKVVPVWQALHNKMESILGTFNVQQIDSLTAAVQSNWDYLKE